MFELCENTTKRSTKKDHTIIILILIITIYAVYFWVIPAIVKLVKVIRYMSRNWKHPLSSPDGISVTDYQQYERYNVRSASMENRFSVSLARVRTGLLYRVLFSYDFMWTFFGSMPALVNAHRRVNLLVVGYRIRATSQKSLPFKVTFLSNLLLIKTYISMSLHLVTVELLIRSIWGLPRACGFHRNDPHSCSVDLKGTGTTELFSLDSWMLLSNYMCMFDSTTLNFAL